ncbi:MAG: ATP-binding protein, partial [Planctomycetaceae bacterium]|nr:ATP-binding protein [Planctomycetaceae bacterium]
MSNPVADSSGNPYSSFGCIVTGERLVGREELLSQLTTDFCDNVQSVSLVGPPRIGKSSFASELFRRIYVHQPDRPFVWVTVSAESQDFSCIFNDIVDGVLSTSRNAIAGNNPTIFQKYEQPADDARESYRRCRNLLEVANRCKVRTLVVFDEFDAVRKFPEAGLGIQQIRELLYHPNRFGLSAIIVSRRRLKLIERWVPDISTLAGVCPGYYITPLTRSAIQQMIGRSRGRIPEADDVIDLVYRTTGGHPWLADMILHDAWKYGDVAGSVASTVAERMDYYDDLVSLIRREEEDLYDALLQLCIDNGPVEKPGSAAQLERYGIIRRVDTSGGFRYQGWSADFQEYLQVLLRQKSLFQVWQQTEIAVRDLIENVLRENLGEDWLHQISHKHRSLQPVIQEAR